LYAVVKPYLVQWATGEGSFVVVGLLEGLLGNERNELALLLKKSQESLKENGGDNRGTKLMLNKIGE
jgi:hypothetical protein